MDKVLWLIICVVSISVRANTSNIAYAVGEVIPWFLFGMLLSPVWWFLTKRNRVESWKWFQWLNAGALITLGLFVLRIFLKM